MLIGTARRVRPIITVALSLALVLGWVPIGLAASVEPTAGRGIARAGTLPVVAPPGLTEVVLYSRQAKTSTVVSHGPNGITPIESSSRPSVSSDGSFVAFESDAPLQASDTNLAPDVYLWERAIDISTRISLAPGGGDANGESRDPSISGDGNIVAFASTGYNLTSPPTGKGFRYVYAWNRLTATMSLVSTGADGPGEGSSTAPSVSLDGRVVGFESTAENLVAEDTNGDRDVFLRDLDRGATIRASVSTVGAQATAESRRPSVSGDGGAVAFDSIAPALVPKDSNRLRDVFVRDLPPAVQVAPNPLEFGVVQLGTPKDGSVSVVSVGWTPVTMVTSAISGTHASDFVVAGDLCAGQTLPYGASCSISVLFVPTAADARTATLEISDTALDSPQLVSLLGGVAGADLQLNPSVGPGGVVTILRGTGFPPGAFVTVAWDRGITQPMEPVLVGVDGSFAMGVLVFHNDVGGARQLIVSAAPGGPTFAGQALPFLVVAGSLQPPGAADGDFTDPEIGLPLIR